MRRRVRRRRGQVELNLPDVEMELLASLVDQFIELLRPEVAPVAAPWPTFERPGLDDSDPVIQRLFPPAYRIDSEADAEYRRFAESDALRRKLTEAQQVRTLLDDVPPVVLDEAAIGALLRTLNALRLTLASRLGVVQPGDEAALAAVRRDDPRAFVIEVYEWLGELLAMVLDAIER